MQERLVEDKRLPPRRSAELKQLAADAQSYIDRALEDGTAKSYGVIKHAYAFNGEFNYEFPWDADDLIMAVAYTHRQTGKSYKQCVNFRAAVKLLHLENEWPDPTISKRVERLFQGLVKEPSLHPKLKRDPVPIDMVREWHRRGYDLCVSFFFYLALCLMIVGMRCMARGSELARLEVSNVSFVPNGMRLHFSKTKTRPAGRDVFINSTGGALCPVRAMRRYIAARSSLRPKQHNGKDWLFVMDDNGKQLTTDGISKVLQRVQELLQYAVGTLRFTSHSLRIGGCSLGAAEGMTKEMLMIVGDWSSDAIERYMRSAHDPGRNISKEMGF
jgi:integrase